MKWLESLKLIAENKKPEKCPYCQGFNLDYAFSIVNQESMMGYGVIWCNDCHNAYYISRVKISNNLKIGVIPAGLKY